MISDLVYLTHDTRKEDCNTLEHSNGKDLTAISRLSCEIIQSSTLSQRPKLCSPEMIG